MFRSLTLGEIAKATGGTLVEGPHNEAGTSALVAVSSVSTDTRTIGPDALFVAIKGEKFDGHSYLGEAFQKGATGFLVSRQLTGQEAMVPHVVVPDTVVALGKVARLARNTFTGPVVAVTGSVGKTTAKEMIATVLEAAFTIHKSEANYNNEIGVPQTILSLTESDTALVLEMGMRGAGQIKELCDIAAPTIGVITGIGLSHIELLGSRENIAAAKGELFQSLPEDGLAVFPATDGFANTLRGFAKSKVLTVAVDSSADIQATNLIRHENGWRFTVNSPWGMQKMFIPSPGRFNVENALFAVAVGGHLGIPLDSIARALLRWTPPPMRLEILRTEKGVTVLSDAYNAAPDSMIGALETLREMPVGPNNKRIAVLGDMRELGSWSPEAHAMIGRAAAKVAPDMLILVGEAVKKTAAGAIGGGFSLDHLHQLDTTAEAVSLVPFIVQPGDVVLVKASRAMGLEKVVAALGPAQPVESKKPEDVAPEPIAEPVAEDATKSASVTESLGTEVEGAASNTPAPDDSVAAPFAGVTESSVTPPVAEATISDAPMDAPEEPTAPVEAEPPTLTDSSALTPPPLPPAEGPDTQKTDGGSKP